MVLDQATILALVGMAISIVGIIATVAVQLYTCNRQILAMKSQENVKKQVKQSADHTESDAAPAVSAPAASDSPSSAGTMHTENASEAEKGRPPADTRRSPNGPVNSATL